MDPVTALIFSLIVAHLIMRNAWSAGVEQARTEARTAREAIRRDLGRRRTEAARNLERRLAEARETGPRAALWWAWAGLTTGRALRRAVRRRRRQGETNPRAIRGTTGPFRRIWEAAWRAAVFTAREGRRQWEQQAVRPEGASGARPQDVPVGICERCGAVTAKTALALAPSPSGRMVPMCARCRASAAAKPAGPSEPPRDDAADVPDAEVVEPAPRALPAPTPAVGCVNCGHPLVAFACANIECPLCPGYIAASNGRALPRGNATHSRLPVRYCPECSTQLVPSTWYAVNATNGDVCLFCARSNHGEGETRERQPVELAAIGQPLDSRGRPVDPGPEARAELAREASRIAIEAAGTGDAPEPAPTDPAPGGAAPAGTSPTGEDEMTCAPNGEVHTQAAWHAQATAINESLGDIVTSAENALRCLDAKQAGRTHMQRVKEWADEVNACMEHGKEVLASVNARQDPYVDAVQSAGGSAEVAVPDYYDEL